MSHVSQWNGWDRHMLYKTVYSKNILDKIYLTVRSGVIKMAQLKTKLTHIKTKLSHIKTELRHIKTELRHIKTK